MFKALLRCAFVTAALGGTEALAQFPGGVTPAAWYRADGANTLFSDAGTTAVSTNGSVQQWNEALGSGRNLVQANATYRPVFSNTARLANFNPTVTFDGTNDYLQFTAPAGDNMIDRATGAIYVAGGMNTFKRSGFAGFNATMDYPGLHVYATNGRLLFFTGGPGYQGQSTGAMTDGASFTAGTGWENGLGSSASYAAATVSLNGTRQVYNGAQLNNVNLSTSARDFRIGADNNYGAFSGQLNEVLVYENRLSAAELDRLESYLALKYGTTYAGGTADYKNAAGGVVWAAAANAGWQNNIAGIARDDNGALYQKQSWSTNAGNQVLIGVGGLAATNAMNSGTLADGQYLIWGDNGLAKTPSVVISGIAGVTHRFAATWKVQQTGAVGLVRIAWPKSLTNLRLIQSADNVFNALDIVTDMSANEVTVNGIPYNYADVTLGNGQYFTFASKLSSPGGIFANLRVWLKADSGFTPSSWYDNSGNSNTYLQTNASRQPFTAATLYNFNPVVDFGSAASADGRFMVLPAGKPFTANGLSGTFLMTTLTRTGGTSGYRDILGFGGTTTGSALTNANAPTLTKLNNDLVLYSSTASAFSAQYPDNTLLLTDASYTVNVAGIKYGLNGATAATTQTRSAGNSLQAGGSILGSQPEVNNGLIGEVIAYERDLAESEKQLVRSYLAVKYGITLPHNYTASDGATIMWSQAVNAGFNKNIAGIANDEGSALVQKQSRSVNSGQQVVIGTTGMANANALNNVAPAAGQSLLWGDNGLSKTLSVAFTGVAGLNLRFAAIWKAQNVGSVGTVRVAWPSGIVSIHLVQSADSVIDASDTRTDMSTNTQIINGVAYNYADVTLADGQYFTFAGYVAGPGGVGQDLSLWYRADNGVETDANAKVTAWNNSTANNVKLTMSGANAYIPYNDQTTYTRTWNFNPTLSFDGTNNYLRNITATYLNPAGSVHYIAVARLNAAASGYNSIFAITGNDDGFFLYPQSGLVYPMPAIGNNFSVTAAGPGAATRYGIYSAILPKTGTPANQRGFYNGLQKIYTSPYPVTGGSYALSPTPGSNTGAFIGADGSTADNPNGDIAEVILYHGPSGGDMANADLLRIHSYLAIKYGITLDQSTPQSYLNANGDTVWHAGNNAGYRYNIGGIARDDQGGLYQKQSRSVNPGNQVLISTTGLAGTNATNAGVFTNGQFLIWGDNNLAKSPVVALAGVSGVNYRFAAIWKVQNTNAVGTIRIAWPRGYANLKLIQSADNVITSSDAVTDMGNVQTVNGIDYAYADVTLANGQFFTFAAYIQAPGGVSNNLSYWYRADKFTSTTTEGDDVDAWTDFTSGCAASALGDNDVPKLRAGDSTYFNFNPGISFTTVNQSLGNINVQTLTNTAYDVFTLTKEGISPGGNGRVFSALVSNANLSGNISYWDGLGLMADGRLERVTSTYTDRYLANPGNIGYSTTAPSIMYNRFTDVSAVKGLNGAATGTPSTHTARGQFNGGHAIGSTVFSGNGSDNAGFTGHIGELVVYGNGNLSAAERNKVETYLAVKYGVTLAKTNNYTTSQDVVIWNAAADTLHYNNVAGIGRDTVSALLQKQGRSQLANTNGQVMIGLGDIAATNAANTSSLANGQFLVWGDNGNVTRMAAANTTYKPLSYAGTTDSRRMLRVWKVRNTNNITNDLLIRFPAAFVGATTLAANDACAAYSMVFADDSLFTVNVTVKPLAVNGDYYEATAQFHDGVSYFTFGKVTPATTGQVYLPAVVETTNQTNDNCGIGGAWTYFRKQGDPTMKLLATAAVNTANLTATITPEGVHYDDGTTRTTIMPRIATVTDATSGTYTGVKVRVYYDQTELDNTMEPGAISNGWFKYSGNADDVITDVFGDGRMDISRFIALTPSASGIEDGIRYVEFSNITSFSSFLYLSSTQNQATPLPVRLTSFNVTRQGAQALLEWATATEQNNYGFEVERSADGREWTTLGFVGSKPGNAGQAYVFHDASPLAGSNYYRLKQIDLGGGFTYSSVRMLAFGKPGMPVTVSPNPVRDALTIQNINGDCVISVSNTTGQVMLRAMIRNVADYKLDMSHYKPGIYLINVQPEGGTAVSCKVTKE